jgi:hypothetical protein
MSKKGRVEAHDLSHLFLIEEPICDSALVQDLDRPRVQAACARAGQVLAGRSEPAAADTCQQLRAECPSCTASPAIGSTSPRDPYVDNNTRISCLQFPSVLASTGNYAARLGSCFRNRIENHELVSTEDSLAGFSGGDYA